MNNQAGYYARAAQWLEKAELAHEVLGREDDLALPTPQRFFGTTPCCCHADPIAHRRHSHIELHFDPVSLWVRLR